VLFRSSTCVAGSPSASLGASQSRNDLPPSQEALELAPMEPRRREALEQAPQGSQAAEQSEAAAATATATATATASGTVSEEAAFVVSLSDGALPVATSPSELASGGASGETVGGSGNPSDVPSPEALSEEAPPKLPVCPRPPPIGLTPPEVVEADDEVIIDGERYGYVEKEAPPDVKPDVERSTGANGLSTASRPEGTASLDKPDF